MRYIWKYMAPMMMTLAVLLGCSSESYPGIEYEPAIPDALRNDESGRSTGSGLPISLSVTGPSFQISNVTRGLGPLDNVEDVDRFKNARFYVFAFRDYPDDQGSLAYNPSFKQHSQGDSPDCLVDDSNNDWLGLPARIDIESGYVHLLRKNLRVDSILYYGTRHQDIAYNFYMYHIDDVNIDATNAHRDETGIYYDLELNGTQDVMTGHSVRFTDEMLRENYPGYSELPLETQNHILNIGNYSAYSANYDVNPILYMRHLLTQLKFYAYPGDKSCREIQFKEIQVEARYKGRLYVVNVDVSKLDFTFDDEMKFIPLMEPTKDEQGNIAPYQPLTPENYKIEWSDDMSTTDWTQNPSVHLGGDMLLPQATAFHLKVAYQQKDNANPLSYRTVEADYMLQAPEIEESQDEETGEFCFLPSKSYAVKLGIFGGRVPEVEVSLDGWQDGGEIEIGGDGFE